MNGAYLATAGRIRQELAELDQVVARIENIWTRRRQEPLPADQAYGLVGRTVALRGKLNC